MDLHHPLFRSVLLPALLAWVLCGVLRKVGGSRWAAAGTAFALLIEIPELGGLHEKAAAALCGLAPMNRQSGRWTGRAFIIGGRAIVRQALYMPALVAARFNPDLKAKYEALIKAGKAPKVAITALMRKMIGLANALLRQKRKWAPKLA